MADKTNYNIDPSRFVPGIYAVELTDGNTPKRVAEAAVEAGGIKCILPPKIEDYMFVVLYDYASFRQLSNNVHLDFISRDGSRTPSPLSKEDIDKLKNLYAKGGHPRVLDEFSHPYVGERVTVIGGAFDGLEGVVRRTNLAANSANVLFGGGICQETVPLDDIAIDYNPARQSVRMQRGR